jgi:putative membrane protein
MSNRFALLSSAATIALMVASPAFAQSQPTPDTTSPPSQATPKTMNAPSPAMPGGKAQLSAADRNFVTEAAIGGMTEVDLGKLAQQNSQDQQVQQFGAKMVQDHGAANDQLTKIATDKGVTLPQQLDRKGQALHDRLAKLQGVAFDRAYMADMIKDHNADMTLFRHEAQSAKDPDVKQFAQQTLATIQEHDKLARDVGHSLTATGSSRPPK